MHAILKTPHPRLVAIVGNSGSGKSWLAGQMQRRLGKDALVLSLDDFYRDRSHLSPARRALVNYDHPRAVDWAALEEVLRQCRAGRPFASPRYDFARHARHSSWARKRPKPLVIVEGLWLLRRPCIRRFFSWRIFIDCPRALSLRRRVERDHQERGRSKAAVRARFCQRVAPMSRRYVQPQKRWADVVMKAPLSPEAVDGLVACLRQLSPQPGRRPSPEPGIQGGTYP